MAKMYTVKKEGDSYTVYKGGAVFHSGLTGANARSMAKQYNEIHAEKRKRFGLV